MIKWALTFLLVILERLIAFTGSPDSTALISITPNYGENTKILISDIKVVGNAKTRPEIILREMKIKPNTFATTEEIEYDINRIMSLGIFNDVSYVIDRDGNHNILFVIVRESWYIFPLPYVDIADRDWKKLSYGMLLLMKNVSGKNDRLSTGISLGYDPNIYLSYFDPNFDFNNNLGFKFLLQAQKRKNKSIRALTFSNGENYHENYFELEFSINKRFDLYTSVIGSIGYEYIHVPSYLDGRTINETGIDRLLNFQLIYSYDSRDFIAYPRKGSLYIASIKNFGLSKSLIDYSIVSFELKKIYFINPFIMFFRNYTRSVFGSIIPYYANSFLGFNERLRGRFNEIYESNSLNFFTFEIRLPLIDKYLLQFDLPKIPASLTTYNIGIDFHFFFDSALMWDKNDRIRKNQFINGVGAGFTFLVLPYRGLNFEIGFSPKRKPEFIIDLIDPL